MLAESIELVVQAVENKDREGFADVLKMLDERDASFKRAIKRLVHKISIGYVLTPEEVVIRDYLCGDDLTGLLPHQLSVADIWAVYTEQQQEFRAALTALYEVFSALDTDALAADAGKAAIDTLYAAQRAEEEARAAAEREEEEKRLAAERKAKERRAAILAKHAAARRLLEQENGGGDAGATPAASVETGAGSGDAGAASASAGAAASASAEKTAEQVAAEAEAAKAAAAKAEAESAAAAAAAAAEAVRRAALHPLQDPEAPPVSRRFASLHALVADAEQGLPFAVYCVTKEWRRRRGAEALTAHVAEVAAAREKMIEEAHERRNANVAQRAKELATAQTEKTAAAHQAADDFYKFLLEQGAPEEGAKAAADEKREMGLATAEEELKALADEHQKANDEERDELLKLTGEAGNAAAEGEGEGESGEGAEKQDDAADDDAAAAVQQGASSAEDAAKYGLKLRERTPLMWERRFARLSALMTELKPSNQLHLRVAALRTREEPWARKVVKAYNKTLDFLDDWQEYVSQPVPGAGNSEGGFFARRRKRRRDEKIEKMLERRGPMRGQADLTLVKWLVETRKNHKGFTSARWRVDFHKYTVWLFTVAYLTRNFEVMRSLCTAPAYARMVELFNKQADLRPGQKVAHPSPSRFIMRKEPVFYKAEDDGDGGEYRWEYQFKFRYPRAFEDVQTGLLTEGALKHVTWVVCILHAQLDLENPDSNYKIVAAYFKELQSNHPLPEEQDWVPVPIDAMLENWRNGRGFTANKKPAASAAAGAEAGAEAGATPDADKTAVAAPEVVDTRTEEQKEADADAEAFRRGRAEYDMALQMRKEALKAKAAARAAGMPDFDDYED